MAKVDLLNIAIGTHLAFCGGYLYGLTINCNEMLAAKAAAVSYFSFKVITEMTFALAETGDLTRKNFKAVVVSMVTAWGIISIIAFRHLNLIANTGTVVLSGFLVLKITQLIVA